jgi:metallophosphoesterase (TIGR00282 family)
VKLLFIGDVVGQPGRRAVKELLPKVRDAHAVDLVIANCENAAGGSGITLATARELFDSGVEVMTMGDHLWDQKDVIQLLEKESRLVRPINYPPNTPGQGCAIISKPGLPDVAVINVQGRTFLADLDNPFRAVQEAVFSARKRTSIIFVDVHAEATSEKIAMGRMLDGHASAVIGTHTHVQTADEQIFPGGTAFLCDAGFTGPHESVIGRDYKAVIERFLTNMPQRFEVASGRIFLQGAVVDVDESTGKARSIVRVSEHLSGT